MRKQNLFHKGMAVLLAAAMAITGISADGLSLHAKAEGGITVNASAGYAEGAYVTWTPVENATGSTADGYEVYVSQDQTDAESWVQLDDELIRNYGSYLRADILGLTPGTWYVKIVAADFNSAGEKLQELATQVEPVTVTAQDRSGFAWTNGTASGAYNEDGSLKSDAVVIYVTESTKDKVTVTLDDGVSTATGIQNIFNAYAQGKATKPLDVRMIGKITDPATLISGDLKFANVRNSDIGVTIEGVGEDATVVGFGLVLEDSSNVEIRNLGFMLCDSKEGDSVSLVNNNDHVWVHNCDLFYGMPGGDDDQAKGDGAMDSKKSNYVTFSYNHFWDCGKSCLLGLEENETDKYYITYHHNWFDHSDSRHPRIRYYSAHIYNNYFDGNSKYGVGATCGSSVFVENNYFRNCVYPMKISMQGSDNGTFSQEPGGMIKAYGNYMTGQEGFINGNANVEGTGDGNDRNAAAVHATSFDAYVVSSRSEQIPASVVTLNGGTSYNNFDTAPEFYSYSLTATMEVPSVVTAKAGRLNGGDFQWTFDNSVDDASHDVNEQLKEKLFAYESSLVSVGGILGASEKVYCTVTLNPNNGQEAYEIQAELNQPLTGIEDPTVIPEGYVEFGCWMNGETPWDMADPVTGDMTLVAKYLTQAEADANKRGGTPIGETKVQHSIIDNGFGSAYFEIKGDLKAESSYKSGVYAQGTEDQWTVTNGRNGRLTFNTSAYIKFTTTTETSLLVVLMDQNSSSAILVDGETVAPLTGENEKGVLLATLGAGEHVLAGKSSCYVTGIMVVPGEKVPEVETEYDEDPDNLSLNVGEDMENATYTEDQTVKGFTIKATASSTVAVDSNSKNVDGVSYSARLKTGGSGSTDAKSVMFTTKGAATLYIAAMASAGSAIRSVTVSKAGEAGATTGVSTFSMAGDKLYSQTVPLTEAGTYYIWADGGLNIYAIKVTYPVRYAVKFDSKGGTSVEAAVVSAGNTLTRPEDPTKEGYTFTGWYTDEDCTQSYDFNAEVKSKFTLYAGWAEKGLYVTFADPAAKYTYTGSAIKPQVTVKNNGAVLKEGVDYTLKYTNNINASGAGAKKPTVTVTGKGNLTGSCSLTFEIERKALSDDGDNWSDGVIGGDVVTDNLSKAVPVISYNGVTLKANKDFKSQPVNILNENFLLVEGFGNYSGSIRVKVSVKAKSELKKFAVKVVMPDKNAMIYDGTEKTVTVEVRDSKSKAVLREKTDYAVSYTNNVNAGTAKVTVIGMGDYSGAVTKSFTIKPKQTQAKIDTGSMAKSYTYVSTGVTVDGDLKVSDADGTPMEYGKDYKITYSANKKIGTAKYTVSFLGNYKGSKALTGTFLIKEANLKDLYDAGAINIATVDKTVKKPGVYKSVPYVSVNGTALKTSDMTITYYVDAARKTLLDKNNPAGVGSTVYVKLQGKGNYTGELAVEELSYRVATADSGKDLSKAKVVVNGDAGKGKATYTGEALEPQVTVTIGSGNSAKTLKLHEDYEVVYVNNINKGKATVVITAVSGNDAGYAGGKAATFSIVSRSLKTLFGK